MPERTPAGAVRSRGGVLVVGVGNTLRGDDAAAAIAVGQVQDLGLPDVRVHTTHQLLPELAGAVARAGRVVVVDAAVGLGHVRVARVVPRPGPPRSHHLEPAGLLGLAALLDRPLPDAFEVGIPAYRFTVGAPLSAGAERAVPVVVRILRWLCPEPPSGRGEADHPAFATSARARATP